MDVAANDLSPRERYFLMTTCIVPRPIAWISTQSIQGIPNLAPFSYFMGIGSRPAMLAVAVGQRGPNPKDTARNCRETHEFVVNMATRELAAKMHQTAADYPPDVDEFNAAGLTTVDSVIVAPPGVAESPVRMECRVHDIMTPGTNPTHLVIGEILHFHLHDDIVVDGVADVQKFNPLGRLGKNDYMGLGDIFTIPNLEL